MALSNWATLAFDQSGKKCEGKLSIEDKIGIEIRKCSLYVKNLKAKKEEDEMIMRLNGEGVVGYCDYGIDFDIHFKVKNDTCFVIVTRINVDKKYKTEVLFGGIGVYAFGGKKGEEELNVTQKKFDAYLKWSEKTLKDSYVYEECEKWLNKVRKTKKISGYNQGTAYFAKHGIKGNPLLALNKQTK